ncbi:MAG: cupin domain-containing protein [Chloroflexota bacterium]
MNQNDSARQSNRVLNPAVLAVNFDSEIAALKSESAWQTGGRNAKTLFKEPADLRIVLMVLKSGAGLVEHSAPGPLTLQVMEGRVRVGIGGDRHEFKKGSMVVLEAKRTHDLEALDDSALLLTIAWPVDDSRV